MTVFSSVFFAAFEFENNDFTVPFLRLYLRLDGRAIPGGSSDLRVSLTAEHEHLVEDNLVPNVPAELFHAQLVAFIDFVLLTA